MKQFYNLKAGCCIQSGCRFVSNKQFRLIHKGRCYHNSLTLSTRQLMRISMIKHGIFQIQFMHEHPGFFFCLIFGQSMKNSSFCNLNARLFNRIQRCHRLLKNHRNRFSPKISPFTGRKIKYIFTANLDFS